MIYLFILRISSLPWGDLSVKHCFFRGTQQLQTNIKLNKMYLIQCETALRFSKLFGKKPTQIMIGITDFCLFAPLG